MRFAYENLKLFACYLVLNFRIAKRPDTEVKYKPGSAIVVGFKPLYLDLVDIKNKKWGGYTNSQKNNIRAQDQK